MDLGSMVASFSWSVAVSTLLAVYALSIAVFLILENRSPPSTFAWMFLLLVFPVGGLAIYALFGRNRHFFSRTATMTHLLESPALATRAAAVVAAQPAALAALPAGRRVCASGADALGIRPLAADAWQSPRNSAGCA